MRRTALRLTILGLVLVCIACNGQPNDPTAPSLAGLGSLSSEAKGGRGGGVGGGEDATYEVSIGSAIQFATLQTTETYGGGADADSCCIVRFDNGGPNDGKQVNVSFLASEGGHELNAYGSFSGDWPPALDVTENLALDSWDVTNRNKKDAKKGPCEGAGNFSTTLTVERTL